MVSKLWYSPSVDKAFVSYSVTVSLFYQVLKMLPHKNFKVSQAVTFGFGVGPKRRQELGSSISSSLGFIHKMKSNKKRNKNTAGINQSQETRTRIKVNNN
ncbi:hypothetical protein AMECASPLE_001671 [Ameca splendens]|uniref:Uncharacterized protein n=1 Tax=Ameca splendens TaxID=208324 RepID=A0ABV0X9Z3_9TELE